LTLPVDFFLNMAVILGEFYTAPDGSADSSTHLLGAYSGTNCTATRF